MRRSIHSPPHNLFAVGGGEIPSEPFDTLETLDHRNPLRVGFGGPHNFAWLIARKFSIGSATKYVALLRVPHGRLTARIAVPTFDTPVCYTRYYTLNPPNPSGYMAAIKDDVHMVCIPHVPQL